MSLHAHFVLSPGANPVSKLVFAFFIRQVAPAYPFPTVTAAVDGEGRLRSSAPAAHLCPVAMAVNC